MSTFLQHIKKTFTYSSEIFFPGLITLFRGISTRVALGLKTGEIGPATARREIRLVADIASDLKRVLPTAAFMALPFYWTSPIVFWFAPGLIPKSFYNLDLLKLKGSVRSKLRQRMKPEILNKVDSGLQKKLPSDQYMKWQKILSNESKIVFSFDLFRNNLNLFNMPYRQATLFAKNVGLALPFIYPKTRLLKWIDWILKDDVLIDKEGVRSLSEFELLEALEDRGLSVNQSLSESRAILNNYLQFSNNVRKICLDDKSRLNSVQSAIVPLETNKRLNAIDKGAILSALIISNSQKI